MWKDRKSFNSWKNLSGKISIHLNQTSCDFLCEGEGPEQKLRRASPPTAGALRGTVGSHSWQSILFYDISSWFWAESGRITEQDPQRVDGTVRLYGFLIPGFSKYMKSFPVPRREGFDWWSICEAAVELWWTCWDWGDGHCHCNTWFLNTLRQNVFKTWHGAWTSLKKMEIPLDFPGFIFFILWGREFS